MRSKRPRKFINMRGAFTIGLLTNTPALYILAAVAALSAYLSMRKHL
jgi:hypothetical protein